MTVELSWRRSHGWITAVQLPPAASSGTRYFQVTSTEPWRQQSLFWRFRFDIQRHCNRSWTQRSKVGPTWREEEEERSQRAPGSTCSADVREIPWDLEPSTLLYLASSAMPANKSNAMRLQVLPFGRRNISAEKETLWNGRGKKKIAEKKTEEYMEELWTHNY